MAAARDASGAASVIRINVGEKVKIPSGVTKYKWILAFGVRDRVKKCHCIIDTVPRGCPGHAHTIRGDAPVRRTGRGEIE